MLFAFCQCAQTLCSNHNSIDSMMVPTCFNRPPGNYPATPPLSGLSPESCDVPGRILVAFNYCVLPMQVEAVLPVVSPGRSHCINIFQSKFEAFLLHLDCHLSLSVVKSYKAMLISVFHLKGFNLSTDQVLQEVIHTCSQWIHRTTPGVLPWNVDVVLLHFVGTPFEPLHQTSLRLLTQNTFLVALETT